MSGDDGGTLALATVRRMRLLLVGIGQVLVHGHTAAGRLGMRRRIARQSVHIGRAEAGRHCDWCRRDARTALVVLLHQMLLLLHLLLLPVLLLVVQLAGTIKHASVDNQFHRHRFATLLGENVRKLLYVSCGVHSCAQRKLASLAVALLVGTAQIGSNVGQIGDRPARHHVRTFAAARRTLVVAVYVQLAEKLRVGRSLVDGQLYVVYPTAASVRLQHVLLDELRHKVFSLPGLVERLGLFLHVHLGGHRQHRILEHRRPLRSHQIGRCRRIAGGRASRRKAADAGRRWQRFAVSLGLEALFLAHARYVIVQLHAGRGGELVRFPFAIDRHLGEFFHLAAYRRGVPQLALVLAVDGATANFGIGV